MKSEIQEVYDSFAVNGCNYDITSYGDNTYAIAVTDARNQNLSKMVSALRLSRGMSATWVEVQELNKGIQNGKIENIAELLVKNNNKTFNLMLLAEKTENLNVLFSQTMRNLSSSNVGEVSVVLTCADGKVKYRAQKTDNNEEENV